MSYLGKYMCIWVNGQMDNFIKQTAIDYNMDYEEVELFYRNQLLNIFYDRLEEYIRMRKDKQANE